MDHEGLDPADVSEEKQRSEEITRYYDELSDNPGPIPPDETKTHNIRDIIQGSKGNSSEAVKENER